MSLEPFDRRDFLAGAGGLAIWTLGGQKVLMDREADVARLSRGVEVPPRVAAAESGAVAPSEEPRTVLAATTSAATRDYWIRAEPVRWNIVPKHRDEMMGRRVRGRTTFAAYGYRRYTAGFASPMGPATIPGPLIEAETGDTVVVHFQNRLRPPVTIHPHGIFYSQEMDGAYKGRYTDPGGFVQRNRTFKYVWEARPGTEGAWIYHDHGPMDPLPVYKGLFGPLLIRKAGEPRPDRDFFLGLHSFQPVATGLNRAFSAINGRSFAGNTPTLRANVGERVAFHVYALDNDFHTFHLHGHRWTENGTVIDNRTLGPGDSFTAQFVEDNPGRWFYHCHVFTHLHMGMNGWYVVT